MSVYVCPYVWVCACMSMCLCPCVRAYTPINGAPPLPYALAHLRLKIALDMCLDMCGRWRYHAPEVAVRWQCWVAVCASALVRVRAYGRTGGRVGGWVAGRDLRPKTSHNILRNSQVRLCTRLYTCRHMSATQGCTQACTQAATHVHAHNPTRPSIQQMSNDAPVAVGRRRPQL